MQALYQTNILFGYNWLHGFMHVQDTGEEENGSTTQGHLYILVLRTLLLPTCTVHA